MEKRQRVLFFDPKSRKGGGKAYILNILSILQSSNAFEYHFYINRCFAGNVFQKSSAVQVHFSLPGTEHGGCIRRLLRLIYTKREIRKIKPDIIVFMNEIISTTGVPSILFLRNALYFSKKNYNYFGPISLMDRVRYAVLNLITIKSIRIADVVVTATDAFSQVVQSTIQVKNKQFVVAPFGANEITRMKEKKRIYGTASHINLVCLQFNFYKGIETAYMAVKELSLKFDAIQLIITDNLKEHSDARARILWRRIVLDNMLKHVITTGTLNQQELQNVYGSADIFLFPSFVESFGHGILEAMANGVPCVLSDLPVFKEIAVDAALYFEPGNVSQLCACIGTLVEQPSIAQHLIDRGKERVQKFTWEKHIRDIENIISEMIRS